MRDAAESAADLHRHRHRRRTPSTQIPDASWRTFVKDCLDEAPVTGECTEWASGNDYGTMPNWDTSLVEDMRGYDGGYQGFGGKSTFNGDISRWNTEKVTTMYGYVYSSFCVQPRHWELEHRESDYYGRYVLLPLLRSTKTLGVGTQRK